MRFCPAIRHTALEQEQDDGRRGVSRLAGRRIAVLVEDGVEGELLRRLRLAAAAESAVVIVIGSAATVRLANGAALPVQHRLGEPGVTFDVLALLCGRELRYRAEAQALVTEAYANCKFIGYAAPAKALLGAIGLAPDGGCLELQPASAAAFLAACRELRFWDRERAAA